MPRSLTFTSRPLRPAPTVLAIVAALLLTSTGAPALAHRQRSPTVRGQQVKRRAQHRAHKMRRLAARRWQMVLVGGSLLAFAVGFRSPDPANLAAPPPTSAPPVASNLLPEISAHGSGGVLPAPALPDTGQAPGTVVAPTPPPGQRRAATATGAPGWTSFDPPRNLGRKLTLWATNYYTHEAEHDPGGEPLLDGSGQELGPRLSHQDWCDAAMEGTVLVKDQGKVVGTFNYQSESSQLQVDCSPYYGSGLGIPTGKVRFHRIAAPMGHGVEDYKLVPWRTIATDPGYIPHGTLVYIPAARGQSVKLPSGQSIVHDGYFFAADTGGAINGNHIDVFKGLASGGEMSWIQSSESGTFEAYLPEESTVRAALRAAHTK
jgi:3D (Asp-Asp-Asp) domain-containing protein